MCSALTMMGKIMVVMIMMMIMKMIGMNDNLSEDPKDTRTAPSSAESRRVCSFDGSGRAGLSCKPPTLNKDIILKGKLDD